MNAKYRGRRSILTAAVFAAGAVGGAIACDSQLDPGTYSSNYLCTGGSNGCYSPTPMCLSDSCMEPNGGWGYAAGCNFVGSCGDPCAYGCVGTGGCS